MTIPVEAERLFSRVFHNLTQRHADVITFRKLAGLGQRAAADALSQENYGFALSVLKDSQYDEFFLDRKAAVTFFGGPEKMGADMTAKQLELFNAAVDGASLVFMHSAMDAAISDLCRVTYLIAPSAWRPFVEGQRVTLAELASKGQDDMWKETLEHYLASLDRESLRKRTERLYAVCKPSRTFDPIGNFSYDAASLERLDKRRQDIIHGTGSSAIPNCANELEYLVKTGLYFFSMVNKTFEVRVNPLYAMGLQLPVSSPPAQA